MQLLDSSFVKEWLVCYVPASPTKPQGLRVNVKVDGSSSANAHYVSTILIVFFSITVGLSYHLIIIELEIQLLKSGRIIFSKTGIR